MSELLSGLESWCSLGFVIQAKTLGCRRLQKTTGGIESDKQILDFVLQSGVALTCLGNEGRTRLGFAVYRLFEDRIDLLPAFEVHIVRNSMPSVSRFSASKRQVDFTWGVAPGFCISRRWR